ncbi:MAG: hypothetical protein ACE5LF_02560 [Alphaproteobacteria bacterium]
MGARNVRRRPVALPHRRRGWPAVLAALVVVAAGSAEGGVMLRQEVAETPVYWLDGTLGVQSPLEPDAAGFAASTLDIETVISGEGATRIDAATAGAAPNSNDAAATERAWLYAAPPRPSGQPRWSAIGLDGTAVYDAEFATRDRAQGATLKELLKLYINVVPSTTRASTGGGGSTRAPDTGAGPGRGTPSGGGVLDAVLASPAEGAIGRMISYIFRPAIGIDGLVSFSILGMGSFAIVVTEDKERIGVIDIDTGKSVELSAPSSPSTASVRGVAAPGSEVARRPPPGTATKLADLINAIRDYLYETITSPLRMSAIVMLMLFWGLWRMHGRRV